jgi:hypothetical protein
MFYKEDTVLVTEDLGYRHALFLMCHPEGRIAALNFECSTPMLSDSCGKPFTIL